MVHLYRFLLIPTRLTLKVSTVFYRLGTFIIACFAAIFYCLWVLYLVLTKGPRLVFYKKRRDVPPSCLTEASYGEHRYLILKNILYNIRARCCGPPTFSCFSFQNCQSGCGPVMTSVWIPAKCTDIRVPTLVIWGEKDVFLEKGLILYIEQHVPKNVQVHYIPEASHWVNEDQPEQVNQLMWDFLHQSECE